MKVFNFIPNFLTLSNLFFGCIAVVCGVVGDLEKLALFVSLGLICDFFDGFFARLLKVDSKIGVQLDSLSDLVTFGLTSSVVMVDLIGSSSFVIENSSNFFISILPYSAFLITLSSSYRLAKFNVSSKNTNFFGLPTPANAILIIFLPQFIERFQLELFFENVFVLMLLVFFSSYLAKLDFMSILEAIYLNYDLIMIFQQHGSMAIILLTIQIQNQL